MIKRLSMVLMIVTCQVLGGLMKGWERDLIWFDDFGQSSIRRVITKLWERDSMMVTSQPRQ